MTTIEVEIALMQHFNFREKLIVPNVTDMSDLVKFETDILVLSGSGYASGIEIKVTKSDLKNDRNKNHIKRLNQFWRSRTGKNAKEYYYEKLKHFYYAVPEKLIEETLKTTPNFCGVLSVSKEKYPSHTIYKTKVVRKPQTLFNYKWNEEERYKLARLGTMRIYNLKKNKIK